MKFSAKSEVPVESVMRIYQLVAEIKLEPIANAEGAMTETGGQQKPRNNYAQILPHIKSDPNLFW